MKKQNFFVSAQVSLVVSIGVWGLLTLGGCSSSSSTSANQISTSSGSQVEAVSQAFQPSSSGLTAASIQPANEENADEKETLIEAETKGAFLGTGGCSDADNKNVTVTATCDSTSNTATVTRVLDCTTDDGATVKGTETVNWTNMGAGACVNATSRPLFFKAIQGTGATQVITDPATPASEVITRTNADGTILTIVGTTTLSYSDFSSAGTVKTVTETVAINSHRVKLDSNDTTEIFDHTISTDATAPLVITLSTDSSQTPPTLTRTIESGTVTLVHNLAQYSVTTEFNGSGTTPVVYDYNQCECYPISGVVTFTATGSETGDGTITFSGPPTASCGTIAIVYQGGTITPPKLDACR